MISLFAQIVCGFTVMKLCVLNIVIILALRGSRLTKEFHKDPAVCIHLLRSIKAKHAFNLASDRAQTCSQWLVSGKYYVHLEGWGWRWGFCRAARNIGTGQALLDADDT